ncbi:protein of unknown function [Paenibacillus alvei]|uniref:Uncharacterized protein n=1 Tax=Paenibacillus alvei TaxID=44250 RepID=A0A383RKW2_PAEAL|nr:protein of unknown function [Paenibacillus alvei]
MNRRYSEDISAAWELVEKLSRGRVDNSFVLDFHFERYYATFGEVPIRPCRAVCIKLHRKPSPKPHISHDGVRRYRNENK